MIRKPVLSDSHEIAKLSSQLGYPMDHFQIEERLKHISMSHGAYIK